MAEEEELKPLFAVLSLVPKDFALTAEKDETPQCIEIKFVD